MVALRRHHRGRTGCLVVGRISRVYSSFAYETYAASSLYIYQRNKLTTNNKAKKHTSYINNIKDQDLLLCRYKLFLYVHLYLYILFTSSSILQRRVLSKRSKYTPIFHPHMLLTAAAAAPTPPPPPARAKWGMHQAGWWVGGQGLSE